MLRYGVDYFFIQGKQYYGYCLEGRNPLVVVLNSCVLFYAYRRTLRSHTSPLTRRFCVLPRSFTLSHTPRTMLRSSRRETKSATVDKRENGPYALTFCDSATPTERDAYFRAVRRNGTRDSPPRARPTSSKTSRFVRTSV